VFLQLKASSVVHLFSESPRKGLVLCRQAEPTLGY